MVPKPSGSFRLAIDFRNVNKVSQARFLRICQAAIWVEKCKWTVSEAH